MFQINFVIDTRKTAHKRCNKEIRYNVRTKYIYDL